MIVDIFYLKYNNHNTKTQKDVHTHTYKYTFGESGKTRDGILAEVNSFNVRAEVQSGFQHHDVA
jgi:hypothetical protein